MDKYERELVTEELKFGVKKVVGRNDTTFTLKTVIKDFTSNRRSVFSAALDDVRKAFDCVPHGEHKETYVNLHAIC